MVTIQPINYWLDNHEVHIDIYIPVSKSCNNDPLKFYFVYFNLFSALVCV